MRKGAINWWVVGGIIALLILAVYMYQYGTGSMAQQQFLCDSIYKNC